MDLILNQTCTPFCKFSDSTAMPSARVSELGARQATVLRKTGQAGTGKMALSVSFSLASLRH